MLMSKVVVVRATVSRERRLALALKAVLDVEGDDLHQALEDAKETLAAFGYGDLEAIPTRVARIEAELTKALEAADGKEISRLGQELQRAQAGKPPVKPRVLVAKAATAAE